MTKIYQVGGSVRDELLGVKSKDIDFVVVAPSYDAMREMILARGGKIFLETQTLKLVLLLTRIVDGRTLMLA
jgi:tRNA nucleotidyltransferase/poly(A) polymerase